MSDNDKKLSKFTKDEMELLLHGKDKKFKAKFGDRSINLTYTGIIEKIERSCVRRDIKTLFYTFCQCPKRLRISLAYPR